MSISSRSVRERAFTLLELIVVIVVLAVLAAIAVPTFRAVIDRSQDAATETTVEAMLRDARALVAFQDGTDWDEATAIAAAETASSAAPGAYAAGLSPVKFNSTTPKDPAAGEVAYSVSSDDTTLVLAARSPSGNVCIGAVAESTLTGAECIPPVTPSAPSGSGKTTTLAAALAGDVLSLPVAVTRSPASTPSAPAVVAPAAPTNVAAAPGDASVTVSFTPGAPGSAAVTYTVTSSPGGKSTSGTSSPLTVAGLQNGTSYTFTVTASSSAGSTSSTPSAAVVPAVNTAVSPVTEVQPGATGTLVPGTSGLSRPGGNSIGPNGELFVTDGPGGAGYVAKVVNGVLQNISGPFGEATGVSVTSSGVVYASSINGTVARFTHNTDGTYSRTVLATGADRPMGPTVAPDGSVYYAEQHSGKIMRIPAGSSSPVLVATVTGPLGHAVLAPGNKVYIAGKSRVYVIDVATQQVSIAVSSSTLSYALGVAFGYGGKLYISDYVNSKVYRQEDNGSLTVISSVPGAHGISFAADGSLYVSSYDSGGVYRFAP